MAFAVNFKKITACNKGFAELLAHGAVVPRLWLLLQPNAPSLVSPRAHSKKIDGEKRLAFESELESKLSDDNKGERIS